MEAAEKYLFPKRVRLSSKNDIDRLFDNGQSFISYPLRIVYLPDAEVDSSESGISILVSVPKKRIKHAVKRNRIKRLIRESFRLNNDALANNRQLRNKHLYVAFMYVCDDVLPYSEIETAMLKALKKIYGHNLPTEKITG